MVVDFLSPALLKQDFRAEKCRAVSDCHFIGLLLWESCTNFKHVRVKNFRRV